MVSTGVFSDRSSDSASIMAARSDRARQLPRQAIISSVDIGSNQFGDRERRPCPGGRWPARAAFWRPYMSTTPTAGLLPSARLLLPRAIRASFPVLKKSRGCRRPARRQARDLGRARRAEGRRPAGRRRGMATLSRALHAQCAGLRAKDAGDGCRRRHPPGLHPARPRDGGPGLGGTSPISYGPGSRNSAG